MLAATLVIASAVTAAPPATIEVRWDTASLVLTNTGRLVSLTDLASGRDLARAEGPFCAVETATGRLAPTAATRTPDGVRFSFAGGGALAFRVTPGQGFSLWRLDSVTGFGEATLRRIDLCSLALKPLATLASQINAAYDDQVAVAVMPTEVKVFTGPVVERAQGGEFLLQAAVFRRHGLTPAGFGLIACPRPGLLDAVQAFERAAGLPSPHPGGVWSKLSPLTKHSYLFITSFGEKDADEVIRWAHRGGFDTVLIGEGSWAKSSGHYAINTRNFPGGLPSLVRTADKLRAAGLRVGLHLLGAAVYLNDPYVTPKPDPRLVKDAHVDLASGVDAKADFLPTAGPPPAGFPAQDGGYRGHGTIVQIGDELISYGALRTRPPYGFAHCSRGFDGTTAAPHPAGAPIAHLLRAYGYFLFDLDSSLAGDVIGNACVAANAIHADMMYFDGSENLQGDHWYYNARLQDLYYDHLDNKNALLQGSSYSPYSWHLISRMASADGHGDVKHYLDQRMPGFAGYAANFMPLDIGWYYVYDPTVTPDEYEYILQKCLGFGASISIQTNPENLRTNPVIGRIFDLVRTYDRLRLSGLVPESVRKVLREPGREYRLLRDPLRLRRVVYGKWADVAVLDGKQNAWSLTPAMAGTRLGVQVRCGPLLRPGPAYSSPKAVVLEDFADLSPYKAASGALAGATSPGVTQSFGPGGEGPEPGMAAAKYSATSTLATNAGWSEVGKAFPKPLDLSWFKALGFWLKGDGGGGQFKLQLRDSRYATDYYIANAFTNWRYFQLPRPDKPSPEPIDYSRVSHLLFYYNGLPAGKTVTCWIAGVKALPGIDEPAVVDPSFAVGGRKLAFAVTLHEGERLVYYPGEAPYVVPALQGDNRTLASVADLPISGPTTVVFSAHQPLTALAQVRLVQDCPEELRLPEAALR